MWDTMFTVVLAIAALLIAMAMAYVSYRLVREQR